MYTDVLTFMEIYLNPDKIAKLYAKALRPKNTKKKGVANYSRNTFFL